MKAYKAHLEAVETLRQLFDGHGITIESETLIYKQRDYDRIRKRIQRLRKKNGIQKT